MSTSIAAARRFSFDRSRVRLTRVRAYTGDPLHTPIVLLAERFRAVMDVLDRVPSVVEQIAAVRADRDLSDAGRRRKMAESVEVFTDTLTLEAGHLRDQLIEFVDLIPTLEAAPRPASPLDWELRDAFRSLADDQRRSTINEMIGGQHAELRDALMRGGRFLSGLDAEAWKRLHRAALSIHARDVLEIIQDAHYAFLQVSSGVANALSTLRDAVGRSINVANVDMQTAGVRKLAELLREHRVKGLDQADWFEASLAVDAKTPEVLKARIDASREARRKILQAGGSDLEAERAAQAAAAAIPDPDDEEPNADDRGAAA